MRRGRNRWRRVIGQLSGLVEEVVLLREGQPAAGGDVAPR